MSRGLTDEGEDRDAGAAAADEALARARTDAEHRDLIQLAQLRQALEKRRFVLFAQPIVELATSSVVQHELLIRMIGEGGGLLLPGQFMPTAERFGLVSEVDRWVIPRAARLAARGHAVQVNLSGGTLAEPDLSAFVERELEAAHAHPSLIVFEITETALINNEALAVALFSRVRSLGCGVALDDFGSGYGGFRYLKNFTVDYLKIDREFIADLLTDPASEKVVLAIVQLAEGFQLKTIAEGVEDASTLERLRSLGVDQAQGFLFARPAPAAVLPRRAPTPSRGGLH